MYSKLTYLVTVILTGSVFSTISFAQDELPQSERREIQHVAGDVYRFHDKFHVSVFMVTEDGVIATDPITPDAAEWLNKEINERFGKPVRYVIYSHDHQDHVAGGAAFNGATFIAHENTREPISSGEFPIVMPHITFNDEMSVVLGGKRVELFYHGPGHSNNMIFMRFPEERILFVVDAVELFSVPYRDFPGDDINGLLSTLTALEAVDFDILVSGHSLAEGLSPVGTREDMVVYREYIMTLMERVGAELAAGKSVDDIKASVTMSEYQHLGAYDVWQQLNVEGMARYLNAR